VGQGFGGFLDLCEKVFFLIQYPGAVLPPAGQVFFIKRTNSAILKRAFLDLIWTGFVGTALKYAGIKSGLLPLNVVREYAPQKQFDEL
jgi:hypothetical protein